MWSVYCHLFQPTRTTSVRASAWLGARRRNGSSGPDSGSTMTAYHLRFSTAQSKRTVCRQSNRLLPIQTRPPCLQQPEVVAHFFRLPELLSRSFAPTHGLLCLTVHRRMSASSIC